MKLVMIYFSCECLIFICNTRVWFRVWVTRRVKITRRVWVWNHFLTRMRVRVTRRVKFNPNGYGYGWSLPVGFIPVAIPSADSGARRPPAGEPRSPNRRCRVEGRRRKSKSLLRAGLANWCACSIFWVGPWAKYYYSLRPKKNVDLANVDLASREVKHF